MPHEIWRNGELLYPADWRTGCQWCRDYESAFWFAANRASRAGCPAMARAIACPHYLEDAGDGDEGCALPEETAPEWVVCWLRFWGSRGKYVAPPEREDE